jgi:prolyl 4-hydroxylase
MNEIKNFLSKEDCLEVMRMIDLNHQPSSVVEGGYDVSTISQTRTSSTCNLDHNNPIVQKIHNQIANFLGIDIVKGEHLQGQLYEEGQYFKPHQDFFSGPAYDKHCLASGNRTHTLMIYLNDDFEGGGTNFLNLNTIVKPEQGKAVAWENMSDGECLESAMHEGMPIIKGKKYIITSWWRENIWDGAGDYNAYANRKKVYTNISQIPKLTTNGFEVVKCPEDTWRLIQESYELLKDKVEQEHFDGKENFIPTGDSHLLSFDNLPSIRSLIHTQLQPIHEKFCGVKIEPSFVYGIRSYTKGATLKPHVDRVETHHISSIIIVDKDLRCGCQNREFGDDWPLDIQGHDGEWYKVYAQPGDMILYESAICEHGRSQPFQGNYYRNFFVHYKLI